MKEFFDIKYSEHEECKLDLHIPDCEKFPVLVFFHGGGLESCDKSDFTDPIARPTAEKGVAFVNVNYRMYPNAKFPDFINDSAAAAEWVYKNISRYGNCTDIFLGGSSAGGYLAQMLYFNKEYLGKYHLTRNDFTGFILDAGQPTAHYNILRERGMNTKRVVVDETAPMYFIEDYDEAPPAMILVSEKDIPSRFEQTQLMLSIMKDMGYPAEKIDYHFMKGYSHCEYIWEDIYSTKLVEFIKKTVNGLKK